MDKKSTYIGDYINRYYKENIGKDNMTHVDLPEHWLTYTVSLLQFKFNRKFSYEEVLKLLIQEKIPMCTPALS